MTKWFAVVPLVMILFVTACSSKEEAPVEHEEMSVQETETAVVETETELELFLDITSPADKATVTTESVTVSGETLPVAIVSVNGKIVKVQPDGIFSATVALEIGPNVIQIVASDISGEQTGKVIAIGRVE